MSDDHLGAGTIVILERWEPDGAGSGLFDAYRLQSNVFESFDNLDFIRTVYELPEGVRQINEDDPVGPDYCATFVMSAEDWAEHSPTT